MVVVVIVAVDVDVIVAWFAFTLAAAPDAADTHGDAAWVTVSAERADFVAEDSPPTLRFGATVTSRLPVAVASVDIGIAFADNAEALAAVDVAGLYESPTLAGKVAVIRRSLPVVLAPNGTAVVEMTGELSEASPQPRAFQINLLGYRLARIPPDVLLNMVGTESAADEVAAFEALGLLGDDRRKQQARDTLAGDEALVKSLADEALRLIPPSPSHRETLRRCLAILGLGVIGGDVARAALRDLSRGTSIEHFDEPLQTIRSGRLIGSKLETPLAFVLPASANVMSKVVAHASGWLDGWPTSAEPEATPMPTAPDILPEVGGGFLPVGVAVGVFILAFAVPLLGLWLIRLRKK